MGSNCGRNIQHELSSREYVGPDVDSAVTTVVYCVFFAYHSERMYTILKICHLYKIIHGLCYFSLGINIPNTTITHSTRSLILNHYFARTNSFYNSFIPSSVRLWNLLPEYSISTPNLTLLSIKYLFP